MPSFTPSRTLVAPQRRQPSFFRFFSPLFLIVVLLASLANSQSSSSPSSTAAASYANPFVVPTTGFPSFTAGQATTINWNPTTQGTITLVLRSGSAGNLIAGTPIAQKIANSGSYSWTPDTSITQGNDYTLEIINDASPDQNNFSPYFLISNPNNTVATATPAFTYGAPTGTVTVSTTASSTGSSTGNSTKSGGMRLGVEGLTGGIAVAVLALL